MNAIATIKKTVRSWAPTLVRLTPRRFRGRIERIMHSSTETPGCNTVVRARMRLGYDMFVDLRSGTQRESYYTGEFDTFEIATFQKLATMGWVAFDVGANIGFWTVPLAQTAKKVGGRVYAFEPVPSNYSSLMQHLEQNKVQDQVHPRKIGLSDSRRNVDISLREDFARGSQTGNASVLIDNEDRKFRCIEIEVDTLDNVLKSLDLTRIDFMKVDIEGHEDMFLAGATNTIARYTPILFMEVNEPYYQRRGLDPSEVFESWMARMNYCSALLRDGQWMLRSIRERKRVIDNILFLPSPMAGSIVSRLNG